MGILSLLLTWFSGPANIPGGIAAPLPSTAVTTPASPALPAPRRGSVLLAFSPFSSLMRGGSYKGFWEGHGSAGARSGITGGGGGGGSLAELHM